MKQNRTWVAIIGVLLLATFIRFYHIDVQSFWNDEGNSARLSERSIELIIEGTASDVHPPLYYLLLKGWQILLGNSEFSLRAFSAFLGVLIIPLIFAAGRELIGNAGLGVALTGAFLAAINPALVYYSQEARMYQMLALWATLSTILLIYFLSSQKWKMLYGLAYVLVVAAGLYTHYFFPAVLIAQNLIFAIWLLRQTKMRHEYPGQASKESRPAYQGNQPYWRTLMIWLAMMVGILLIYFPWIPIFLRQVGGKAAARQPLLEFIADSGTWMAFGPTIDFQEVILPTLAYTILLITGLIFSRRLRQNSISFSSSLALSMFVPIIFMWLMGATRPAFYKFLLVAIPPLCLLAGGGWSLIWRFVNRRPVSYLLVIAAIPIAGLILIGTGQSLSNMTNDPHYWRADYRAMAAKIRAEAGSSAAVILNAANQWEVFTYYYQDGVPVIPFPVSYPDPKSVDEALTTITAQIDRVYAIFWGEAERDPNRLVERWLDDHAFKAETEWFGDVRFVTYAMPPIDGDELEVQSDTPVGENIILREYRIDAIEKSPGDVIRVSLYWETDQPLNTRYKVFLHLLDGERNIVTQHDSEPGGGLALTTTWQPGAIVKDNHGLLIPSGTPPGNYELVVGLYDFADPANRLLFKTGEGNVDYLIIANLQIDSGG